MRSVRAIQTLFVLITGALVISPAFASHVHRSPTSGHSHSKRKTAAHQVRGQRQMDTGRAREIQAALIRENYLAGEATGTWDQQSQEAMRSYQAAHHWQTKIIPDSRALIQLGLGPTPVAALGPMGTSANVAAASVAPAPKAAEPKAAEPVKATEKRRTGTSNALTLADAHSILN